MARFGIGIPQVLPGPRADVAALHRFLRRAEHLGFESAWLLDQPIGTARVLEPTAVLANAAAVTTRIRLGTAVLLPPLRIPLDLAKSLATIDQLSGGRLNAGIALGAWQDRYPAFGFTSERRVRRFEEAVGLLKRLWTEPSVTADGEFWQLEGVSVGMAEPAVKRVARLADAWMGAGSATTSDFAAAHSVLVEALEAKGRDPSSFPVGKRVYVAVDPDADRALSRMREWFQTFYGRPELAERVAVWGSAEAVVDGLAEVIRGGAEMLMLNPVFDQEMQAETLAAEVIPPLQGVVPPS
jgi:alkanesulfonate monooxygenase SsuD/methylene tetrahydromethanopterin reductase-like flavin-dependent oxidoreductase (luciferase family)